MFSLVLCLWQVAQRQQRPGVAVIQDLFDAFLDEVVQVLVDLLRAAARLMALDVLLLQVLHRLYHLVSYRFYFYLGSAEKDIGPKNEARTQWKN